MSYRAANFAAPEPAPPALDLGKVEQAIADLVAGEMAKMQETVDGLFQQLAGGGAGGDGFPGGS